jgi:hypothetical protein
VSVANHSATGNFSKFWLRSAPDDPMGTRIHNQPASSRLRAPFRIICGDPAFFAGSSALA